MAHPVRFWSQDYLLMNQSALSWSQAPAPCHKKKMKGKQQQLFFPWDVQLSFALSFSGLVRGPPSGLIDKQAKWTGWSPPGPLRSSQPEPLLPLDKVIKHTGVKGMWAVLACSVLWLLSELLLMLSIKGHLLCKIHFYMVWMNTTTLQW